MGTQTLGTPNVYDLQLGGGAQFWAYLGRGVENIIAKWSVKFEQIESNWSGMITSDNPERQLITPGLSGLFNVTVTAYGTGTQPLQWTLDPKIGTDPNIGCNINCASMVVITLTEDSKNAEYYTTWDAICNANV